MTTQEAIAKLIKLYKEDGFTHEQAGEEMSKDNTPFEIATKVMAGLR